MNTRKLTPGTRHLMPVLLLLGLLAVGGVAHGATNTWYVSPTGNDSSAGTSAVTAFASPGKASSAATASGGTNQIYVASGTYTLSTTTANANGGPVLLPSVLCLMEGYASVPGDLGAAPVISAGTLSSLAYIVKTQGGFTDTANIVVNITVDGTAIGQNNIGYADQGAGGPYSCNVMRLCKATRCSTGFNGCSAPLIQCTATLSAKGFVIGSGSLPAGCYGCLATSCTDGFYTAATGGVWAVRCISASNSGIGFREDTGHSIQCRQCIAYANTGDGFTLTGYNIGSFIDCISVSNSGFGFNNGTFSSQCVVNCAAGLNGTGGTQNIKTPLFRSLSLGAGTNGIVTLTASPFVNAPAGDFRLASGTASGGCYGDGRASGGTAGSLPVPTQYTTTDMGPVQHTDPTGVTVTLSGGGTLSSGTLALTGGTNQFNAWPAATSGTLWSGTQWSGSDVWTGSGTANIGGTTITPSLTVSGSNISYGTTVHGTTGSAPRPGPLRMSNKTTLHGIEPGNKTRKVIVDSNGTIHIEDH